MADLRTLGIIEYKRGTHMRKWEWDHENQKTGGRAVHIVKDQTAGSGDLLPTATEIDMTNATIMVKNLSTTNYVTIGGSTDAVIKVLPGRFALWTNNLGTTATDVTAVVGTVKLEIIVVEA